MRNIRLTIRYDGTDYCGWQTQRNGRAIQAVIEAALKKITSEKVNLTGSGRTDAGVHAMAQVANFKTRSRLPLKNLQMALNAALPEDIAVHSAEEVDLKFDSQRSAKSKLYRYTIYNRGFMDPLLRHFAAKSFYKLDLGRMKRAAKLLKGRHDFEAFRAKDGLSTRSLRLLARSRGEQALNLSNGTSNPSTLRRAQCRPEQSRGTIKTRDSALSGVEGSNHGEERSSVRTVKYIKIEKKGDLVYIDIEADGFLYNMVRNIAGTLIEVGRGKFSVDDVRDIILKKERRLCGPTVPAKGLCLVKVRY